MERATLQNEKGSKEVVDSSGATCYTYGVMKGERVMSENRKTQRQNKYNAINTTMVAVRLNHRTDADILEWLNGVPERGESKLGYIKRLIREDIAKGK